MSLLSRVLSCGSLLGALAAPRAAAQSYHVAKTVTLGGDGGWDYVALDTAGHRLFIARQNRVMVVDPESGRVLAEIPGLERAHGVAFAYAAGHGFATSGGDSAVTMFDLKTLKVLGHTTVAPDDDAILLDPVSQRIFTFNGDAHSASVLDPATGARVGTIDLGGGPEFAVSAIEFECAASWAGCWSTAASTPSRTRAMKNSIWEARTGCRATFMSASKLSFPCSIHYCGRGFARRSSKPILQTPLRRACSMPMAITCASAPG